ncbi:MAG: Plug domain-containing protein, partial [Myxococcota bacterium]|nr:Plug domain-containing protein [Myxococcota bacterium]
MTARRLLGATALAIAMLAPPTASAQRAGEDDASESDADADDESDADAETEADADDESDADDRAAAAPPAAFRAHARAAPRELRGRSSATVDRDELEERVVRSTPDALRAVPGVSIQQTAHGQASPYVRGLTGQQVLLTFDGVRLNNGIFRQGPNQYFFTVDSETLAALHVVRGSASTRLGADALGGAILAVPREPTIDRTRDELI